MTSSEDWVRHLMDRGLLTPEQAERAGGAAGLAGRLAPGAAELLRQPSPVPDASFLITCHPCGAAFPAPGLDPARPPACPQCGGPTRVVTLGKPAVPAAGEAPTLPAAVTGSRFGRFSLQRELGRGGMGVVYEAWDPRLGATVALKMLSRPGQELDVSAVERLLREARAVSRLRHPGIVAVHEAGIEEGRHYFTMEMVEGGSLENRLKESGRKFPFRRRLELLAQVADALAYAHANGVVHRDVKPSNILFGADGRPRLADFGLARELSALDAGALTVSGVVVGTPHYMSPEQASGSGNRVGPASDVFSFGVLLYRAASGRLPFGGKGVEALHATMHDEPAPPFPAKRAGLATPRDRLRAGTTVVCLKCLEKEPRLRYPDGGALAADLRRLLAGETVEASPIPQRPRGRRAGRASGSTPPTTSAPTLAGPQARALRLLEQGRPSLERCLQSQYETDADEDAFGRRLDAARAQFREAIALAPELPFGHYLLGQAQEAQGFLDDAERCFREALRLDRELGAAHYALGRVLIVRVYATRMQLDADAPGGLEARARISQELSEEARRCFDAALAQGSGFEDRLQQKVAEAMSAFSRGDRAAARRLCEQGLAEFPRARGREDLHWMLGLAERGREALVHFEAALAARPRFPVALYARSRIQRELGDLRAVAADVRRVVRAWPGFPHGWLSLNWVCTKLQLEPEAEVAADRAVELAPAFHLAWLNRSVNRHRRGDAEGAVADATRAIELAPAAAWAWGNRAQALLTLGRREEAVRDFRESLRLDPAQPGHRNDLAITLARMGRVPEALDLLGDLLRDFPAHVSAWNNRAALLLDAGRTAEALPDLEQALRLRPEYPEALNNRASARFTFGDLAGAERDAGEALRLRPGYANAWRRRGTARRELGRWAEARADLAEAIRLSPRDAEARLEMARTLAAAGDAAGARAAAQAACDLAPEGSPVRAAAAGLLGGSESP